MFDYTKERREDILCIDVKSFYASVECVARNYHPLEKILVVMSHAENAGGLILASSPKAKEVLHISNVSRKWDLPDHPDLVIVPPRMNLYIEKNKEINTIFRKYVPDEALHIYSIDESFLSVGPSLHLFQAENAHELAQRIQRDVFQQTGLYLTIGIGDNLLLAKLALDIEAKHNENFIAEWRYEDVPNTVWQIENIQDMWGIGQRMAKRLYKMGIRTVRELAHSNFYELKDSLGSIGAQLYANAWGIDRSQIEEKFHPVEKSYGNSQILPRDYRDEQEIVVVIREMAEQVAVRLRQHRCQTACVHLGIRYASFEKERGFSRQEKIPLTANSKKLTEICLEIFHRFYKQQAVRQIGITYSKLTYQTGIQLDLFSEPEQQLNEEKLDILLNKVRDKYGFQAIVHASSLLTGATAITRSNLVGGHAGGKEQKNERN